MGEAFPLARAGIGDEQALRFIDRKIRALPCYAEATVRLERVALERCSILVDSVVADRLDFAERMLRALEMAGVEPYAPFLWHEAGAWSFCAPPMFEVGENAFIVDGSHRVFAARSAGFTSCCGIAITGGAYAKQASDPVPWEEVVIAPEEPHWTLRCRNLDPALFRPVSAVFRRIGLDPTSLEHLTRRLQESEDDPSRTA